MSIANTDRTVPGSVERDFELRDVLRVVRRRRWVALSVPLVALAVGVVVTVRAPRIYSATAKVIIDPTTPDVLSGVREVYSLGVPTYWAGEEYMQTQFEVLKSRPVAHKVAAILGISVAALTEQLQNLGDGAGLEGLPEGAKKRLAMLGLGELETRTEVLAALAELDIAETLSGLVQVVPIKDSRVVAITIKARDPGNAALLANAVADAYVEYNRDQRLEATRAAVRWLSPPTDELRKKLEATELALYEFKRQSNLVMVTIEDRQTMIAQSLSDLNKKLSSVLAERLALESRRELTRRAADTKEGGDAFDAVINNELIQRLKGMVAELQQQEAELGAKYTDQNPKLLGVRQRLERARQDLRLETARILRSLAGNYEQVVDTERRLRAQIEHVKGEALDLDKKEMEYERLRRERDENAAMYELVLKRQKEADLTQMLPVNNVHKHEEAVVPKAPVRPRVRLNLMLALFVGLVLGFASAFVVDHLDNTVKSQEQVEQALGLPFLGIVPAIKSDKLAKVENPIERDQFILAHPRSSVAECCRTIRTNVMFMSPDQPARSILVTSTGPREGKSTTVINLAITMAQSEARTLIVDTDMRRPRLHKTFGVNNDQGISSLILGGCSIEQAIQPSGVPKLDVLPCGPIPPNPAELLHTASFRKLVAELGRRYERIIFDSPPVAAVSDALILTAITDGTVLVVNAGETTWPAALQAKRRIASVGGRIFGVVLNNVDLDDRRSEEYYQYYYYRSGYSDDDGNDKAAAG